MSIYSQETWKDLSSEFGQAWKAPEQRIEILNLQHTYMHPTNNTHIYVNEADYWKLFVSTQLKMGLCEKPEMHSPTGDCCQLLGSGLRRSPGICSCHSGNRESQTPGHSWRVSSPPQNPSVFYLLKKPAFILKHWTSSHLAPSFCLIFLCPAHNSGWNVSSILSQKFSW